MAINYNTFDTSVGRISIEPTLKHAIACGGIRARGNRYTVPPVVELSRILMRK